MSNFIFTSFASRSATAIALYFTLHMLTGGLIAPGYCTSNDIASHPAIAATHEFATANGVGTRYASVSAAYVQSQRSSSTPFTVYASPSHAIRTWCINSASTLITSAESIADIQSPRAP